MPRTNENLKCKAQSASTSQIYPSEEIKVLKSKITNLERKIKTLESKNQSLQGQLFLLNRQLKEEVELKYMFGLYLMENNQVDDFNEWNEKGRPEYTDSWKNECLRHIKENLLPNGIRELALEIQTTK